MKIEIDPSPNSEDLRTQIPIFIKVHQAKGKILGHYQLIGSLDPAGEIIFTNNQAQIHFFREGQYEVEIQDESQSNKLYLMVKEQQYLNFLEHMYPFTFLLGLVLLGVFLWIRKIRTQDCLKKS